LKILYALVFVLSAFAAPAHTLDVSTIAPCELDDCSLEAIELSMMPTSALASEPTIVKLEETDAAAITRPHNAEGGIAIGTVQPSDETQTGTMPAEIVANEPAIMEAGDAVDDADGVTITVVNDPEGVPVGATRAGDETQTRAAQVLASESTIEKYAETVDEAEGIVNERSASMLD
jgi:hypothetical protein